MSAGDCPPELLAGWPLAACLAGLALRLRIRERRRRAELERALHELRRPLQALRLAAGRAGEPARWVARTAEQAMLAAEDLDRVLKGVPDGPRVEPIAVRELVARCAARWRAASGPFAVRVRWRAGAARVAGDPRRIEQALDNLVSNAIEHGLPPVTIRGAIVPSGVRISVADRGPSDRISTEPAEGPRRGHGLAVTAAIAAAQGGALRRWRGPGGSTVVALDLPLAPAARRPGDPRPRAAVNPSRSPAATPESAPTPRAA